MEGNILIRLSNGNYDINGICIGGCCETHTICGLSSEEHLIDTVNDIINLNRIHNESTKLDAVGISIPLSCPYDIKHIQSELEINDIAISVERRYSLHE